MSPEARLAYVKSYEDTNVVAWAPEAQLNAVQRFVVDMYLILDELRAEDDSRRAKGIGGRSTPGQAPSDDREEVKTAPRPSRRRNLTGMKRKRLHNRSTTGRFIRPKARKHQRKAIKITAEKRSNCKRRYLVHWDEPLPWSKETSSWVAAYYVPYEVVSSLWSGPTVQDLCSSSDSASTSSSSE